MRSESLPDALEYASLGWRVVPFHWITDGGCSCSRGRSCADAGKHPCTKNGFNDATDDTEVIHRLFQRRPLANLGIATGLRSGVVALDVDPARGGADSLRKLIRSYGPLAETPRARTGGGGWHYIFQHPGAGVLVPSTSDSIAPGIDIRGDRGAAVLPPSRHRSGKRYTWEIPPSDTEPSPLPDFIPSGPDTERAEENRENGSNLSPLSALSISLREAIETTLPKTQGQRNRKLFAYARMLKSMEDFRDADPAKLRAAVKQWHTAALPNITTKSFDDSLADFLYAWTRVKHPLGGGPLAEALAAADATADPPEAAHYEADETRRLVKLCRELQRRAGDEPFYLTAAAAGEALSIDPMTAWRRLHLLALDGTIVVTEPGKQNRATRYRWRGGSKN